MRRSFGTITQISPTNFRLRAVVNGIERSEYFSTEGSAEKARRLWSRQSETDTFILAKQADEKTLREAIEEVLETTGGGCHAKKLKSVQKHGGFLLDLPLGKILPRHIAEWRDIRAKMPAQLKARKNDAALPPREAKPISQSTVNRELSAISSVFAYATEVLHLDTLINPTLNVHFSEDGENKGKRVNPELIGLLYAAAEKYEQDRRSKLPMKMLIKFAVVTTARLSAIAHAKWEHIAPDGKTLEIPAEDSKNGKRYSIVLTQPVRELLAQLPRKSEFLFGGNANSVSRAFVRIKERAGVKRRFHDLRHEGTSHYMSNAHLLGLTDQDVMKITSHKTPAMLAHYAHLRVTEITDKIDRANKSEMQNFVDDLMLSEDEASMKLAAQIIRARKARDAKLATDEQFTGMDKAVSQAMEQLPKDEPSKKGE